MLFRFLLLLILLSEAYAEDFAGEAYLIQSSVADNGSAVALPSHIYTASQYLDFPGDFGETRLFRVEMATLPLFSDLSQSLNGAITYALDRQTQLNFFGQTITTSDIQSRPLLTGSTEDRLNDPSLRPAACNGCTQFRDVVYMANINLMRKYDWEVPRIDISSRPIPVQFSVGATTKYYYEELEGGDYLSQNLNADLGVAAKFLWGFDPITKISDRNIKIQFSGFELLPTKQKSDFSNVYVYEGLTRRWHLSASWEESLPELNSTLAFGANQETEQGQWPALGVEWGFKDLLYLRGGYDADYISAGASVVWRWVSIHYALRHHELGTSFYQVSGQIQWP